MIKATFIALLLAGLLSACGGEGADNSTTTMPDLDGGSEVVGVLNPLLNTDNIMIFG